MGLSSQQKFLPGLAPDYRPRRSEETVLFKVVAEHLETFLALTEREGRGLPDYVNKEFHEFLKCGVLSHGFLRLKCDGCKHEMLVAFSCKKRGFCSSCGGRRMAETAAHLVDTVFPHVPVRQYVLSLPFPLRFLLAKQSKIQTLCLRIVHRAIGQFLKRKYKKLSGRKILAKDMKCGAVTIVQRFGDGLRLNPHFHMLFLEGVYTVGFDGKPRFHATPPPTDEEIQALVVTIAKRVIRALKRRGYLQDLEEGHTHVEYDEGDNAQEELFSHVQGASVGSRIALGERKGQRVRRLGGVPGTGGSGTATLSGPRCAQASGFSLHADVAVKAQERDKLEKLARYTARNAVSEERLSQSHDGSQLVYRLKRRYTDGTSHLLYTPMEFLEKLASLVPPPRAHLTRYFGILGPHDKHRSDVVPNPEPKPEKEETESDQDDESEFTKKKRMSWAQLLKRVFQIDIETCPSCGGTLKVIAAVKEPEVIKKILKHLKLPHEPPLIQPARAPPQGEFGFHTDSYSYSYSYSDNDYDNDYGQSR